MTINLQARLEASVSVSQPKKHRKVWKPESERSHRKPKAHELGAGCFSTAPTAPTALPLVDAQTERARVSDRQREPETAHAPRTTHHAPRRPAPALLLSPTPRILIARSPSPIRVATRRACRSKVPKPPPKRQTSAKKAFLGYGTAAARHWLLSILIPVAVGAALCYPALFLYYDNPATGSSNLPHHVWTSARRYTGRPDAFPDIEMRQMWIYGSYMKALDPSVVSTALEIQNYVLDIGSRREDVPTGDGVMDGFGDPSMDYGTPDLAKIPLHAQSGQLTWGYHSPLMYWNCSMAVIQADDDFLRTINRQQHRQSFLNLTMRPTSVFAGKSFEGNNLTAADALVITLFNSPGHGHAEAWDKRMKELEHYAPNMWTPFPSKGSSLYEFRFQPMSIRDDFFLAVGYMTMIFYIVYSLRKIRAVKSTFGLVLTVLVQTAISIFGSFTICAVLKFNLTQIPREAYPFVVLVIGLENTFRLINAVLSYPPEMPVITRIANALGDVGHLSLAVATQNLTILYLLSRIVSPEIASFCAFAAVALAFDYSFHLTFFVGVLSVDVKRMELKDSLERANKTQRISRSPSDRMIWRRLFIPRSVPFSTRIAGSAAIIGFVSTLNWHFFDWEMQLRMLKQAFGMLPRERPPVSGPSSLPPSIGQTRTPQAWLRMQEYHTAKEVISVVRPTDHSIVAKVYDPLMLVLSGADRTGAKGDNFFRKVQGLIEDHLPRFLLALVFSLALVTLLIQYLLWNDLADNYENVDDGEDSFLTVKDLPKVHGLDIIKLNACGRGQMASVGLDRSTCIWSFNPSTLAFSHYIVPIFDMNPILWPIIASAVNDTGSLFALYCLNGIIAIWHTSDHKFVYSTRLDVQEQPCHFSFKRLFAEDQSSLRLIIVTRDGYLTEIDFERKDHPQDQYQRIQLCKHALASVTVLDSAKHLQMGLRVIAISKSGCVHFAMKMQRQWLSKGLPPSEVPIINSSRRKRVRELVSAPALNIVASMKTCEVTLALAIDPMVIVHTFQIGQAKPNSLRLLHSSRRICPSCGRSAVQAFSVAYTESETGNCMVHSFASSAGTNSSICVETTPRDNHPRCRGFVDAVESLHWVQNAGAWEACSSSQAIIGLRKQPSEQISSTDTIWSTERSNFFLTRRRDPTVHSNNFFRGRNPQPSTTTAPYPRPRDNDDWEAYTMSTHGVLHTTPLHSGRLPTDTEDIDPLLVANPGPITQLGARSVAVGFGTGIKVLALRNERFEEAKQGGGGADDAYGSVGKRKGLKHKRSDRNFAVHL
ncbi:MAG: hypothetical protein M1820_006866 [Bogoriella megaspora]|nr:MAG: hypothetical protein M1820_006866 [Bogoriella megaspora]